MLIIKNIENKMFSNNINKMPKKSLNEIKQDLGITSKQDGIEMFGLNRNISTKRYNKFLRTQYNKIEREVKKTSKEQKTKQAKQTISKFAQTIQGKKRLNRRLEIRTGINQLDKKTANFSKVKEADLRFILEQLKNVKGRVVLGVNGRYYTMNAYKINQMLQYLEEMFVEGGETEGSDPDAIVNAIMDSLEVSISRPKWLGKSKNNGGFFKYYNQTNIDLTEFGIYQAKQMEYPENCLIQALITFGLPPLVITEIRNMVVPSNPNEATFKYIPTNKLSKIAEQFKLFIRVKKPEEGETRKNKDARVYPTHIKKCPDDWTEINLGLIDNHYFLIKQIPINQYAVENYFDICDKDNYHLYYKKDRKEQRYTNSFKCINYMFNNKDLYLQEIPYDDLLDTQYHDLAKEIKCLEYPEEAVKENEYKVKLSSIDIHF